MRLCVSLPYADGMNLDKGSSLVVRFHVHLMTRERGPDFVYCDGYGLIHELRLVVRRDAAKLIALAQKHFLVVPNGGAKPST